MRLFQHSQDRAASSKLSLCLPASVAAGLDVAGADAGADAAAVCGGVAVDGDNARKRSYRSVRPQLAAVYHLLMSACSIMAATARSGCRTCHGRDQVSGHLSFSLILS